MKYNLFIAILIIPMLSLAEEKKETSGNNSPIITSSGSGDVTVNINNKKKWNSSTIETEGTLKDIDNNIPKKINLDIISDSYKLISYKYNNVTGKFKIFYKQVKEASWRSIINVRFISEGYDDVEYTIPIESNSNRIWYLNKKGDVEIERVRFLENENKKLSSLEVVINNETKGNYWITDIILFGLGTSNSICNQRPVRTIDYNISLDTIEQETNTIYHVLDGLIMTRYCDGFAFIKIPVYISLLKNENTRKIINFSNLEIRKTGYGLYTNVKKRHELVNKLQLLDRQSRFLVEKEIEKIVNDAQWGRDKVKSSQKKIEDLIESKTISKQAKELNKLINKKITLLKKLDSGEISIEKKQSLRDDLVEISNKIKKEEDKLIPFKAIDFSRLLKGGSSGTYDIDKEFYDPFPVWSSFNIAFSLNNGKIIVYPLQENGKISGDKMMSELSYVLNKYNITIGLNKINKE